jgi:peptide/nickel transport system substrate-binding protein
MKRFAVIDTARRARDEGQGGRAVNSHRRRGRRSWPAAVSSGGDRRNGVIVHRLFYTLRATAPLFIVLLLSSCGGTNRASTAPSGSHVLTAAITGNLSPLDPDTYYEAQGLPITQGTYQTLVTYAPNLPKIVPDLATSWSESPDGLTYTFQLRRGVRFSDGTPFNAAAAESSFERRTALKGGPSYQTAAIKSYSTPDPYTLVIHMKQPVAPFLDYLASPYGPMMSSPTGEKLHEVKGDRGSHWIATHSAGTGP